MKSDSNSLKLPRGYTYHKNGRTPINTFHQEVTTNTQKSSHIDAQEEKCVSLRSQVFTTMNLEKLKESLGKASWEKEEDNEAEMRYDRFLML